MTHQEHRQTRQAEGAKLVIAFLLLFVVCITQIIDNSKTVNKLSNSGVTVYYPFYDVVSGQAAFYPKETFKRPLNWYLRDLFDVLIPVILIFLLILNPDFRLLGFNLWIMWAFYFFLILIDRQLFLGKWPFGHVIEVFMIITQFFYTLYGLITDD